MKSLPIVFGLVLAAGAASAQQYTISTAAGLRDYPGAWYGDAGSATSALLNYPFRVAVDSKGNFYFADYYTYVVREVSAGTINTVAGSGTLGFQGDGGPGIQALLSDIHGLAVDSNGNIYIADTFNGVVRKLTAPGAIATPAGIISTFAGVAPSVNGVTTQGYSGDGGPATSAELYQPSGVAVDSSGNVYIADYGNYTVRKVDTKGNISTIAGTGVWGFSGDGGPAKNAMLASPYALAIDPAGNIYISDTSNNNIREITTDGNIHTVVSNIFADSIAVDAAGSIYFSDSIATVGKILPNGTQFVIAGITGNPGLTGDGGPGTTAQLNQPNGVAVDASGNVYVADSGNNLIRLLTPVSSSINVVNSASGAGATIAPGELVTVYGTGGLGPSTPVNAQPGSDGYFGTQLAGTTVSFGGTNAPLLYTSATQVSAIVPYSVPIGGTADVTVTYQGQTFTEAAVPIAGSAPGVFTLNSSGAGPAVVVNQDGSINDPASPAKAGSIVTLYVTGEGQTNPSGIDGKPASAPLPAPVLSVYVILNEQYVPVTYAGGAPGFVAGLMQLNAQIPAGIIQNFTGSVAFPLLVQVGSAFSQANVTISVSQ
ncbi:MAG TPA: IPT/TIG domain-containing protein [Bryobacteraceae bacterium]|jgi:uncharacterized protein (TIGR03437 family)|nr:IPT/TIG domain-containing protein [Bryobacteraceae bacterium]